MARILMPAAEKGSQKWIQKFVNETPRRLDALILAKLNLLKEESIEWRSPLECDCYAEYSDQDFVERLGVETLLNQVSLADFWPKRGPQWDALGRSSSGKLFLVEAKAHVSELESISETKDSDSQKKIQNSLQKVKSFFGSSSRNDWSRCYYQYANRLAYLYLLKMNGLPAYLIFVYFVNDSEMNGPKTQSEWKEALTWVYSYLGVKESRLRGFVTDIFVDVGHLK